MFCECSTPDKEFNNEDLNKTTFNDLNYAETGKIILAGLVTTYSQTGPQIKLNLPNCEFDFEKVKFLSNCKFLNKVIELDLSNNKFGHVGMLHFVQNDYYVNLKVLNLSGE